MRHLRIALISSAIVAIVVTTLSWAGLTVGAFQGAQPRLVDNLFPSISPDQRIALVLIDDQSITSVGRWPWNRSIHADLIHKLAGAGAERIGYDVTFSEASDPAGDASLAQAVHDAGNVVLAAGVDFSGKPGNLPIARKYYPPIAPLRDQAFALGHVSVFPDADGVVRSLAPVIATPADTLLPSLALALALSDPKSAQISLPPGGVRTADGLVPTGPAHLLDVNFTEGFRTYSALDVLHGNFPQRAFAGRTVLVGSSALGLGDYRQTPLDKASGQPGVLIHANALNTILTGSYLKPDGKTTTLFWVFAIALLVAFGVSYFKMLLTPLAPFGVGAAFAALAFKRFDSGAVTNLVYPSIGIGVSAMTSLSVRYFTELRERRRVTRVFSRYLSKDVVEEVLAAPGDAVATLSGASPEISVLFADLRGFTSASEGLPPTQVVSALNIFLDAMTRGVMEENGTVDKFMGDCVMAFWNAPRPEPRHAERAIRAAQRMQHYIADAMQQGMVSALPVRGCGVGVATGEAVVGNIGSAQRLDYTVIGDTVNTASRLCGVAEAGEIVITEACADRVQGAFALVPLPPVSVKGKEEPLRVFRVVTDEMHAGFVHEGHTGEIEAPSKAASYAPIEPVDDHETVTDST